MTATIRLVVASIALLLAAAPALAQSDANVMRERVIRPQAAPAPKRVTTPTPAGQPRTGAGPLQQRVTTQNPAARPAGKPAPNPASRDAAKLSAAPGARPEPAKKPPAPSKAAAAQPPIIFYVATGEPDACGPGCREWIAAEGRIDGGAGARFRAFLGRLGARKLPIYFHSPGGSVGDALEIGRIMRQRRMTAGVGWTLPDGCDLAQTQATACTKLKRAGRDVPAALNTSLSQCNSACVYVVLGAVERRIAAGARLGVHSSKMILQVRTTRPLTPAERARAQGMFSQMARERVDAAYERLGRYIVEMGIDRGLLDAARRIPHEQVRYLTRDEIAQFGIDRRPFVEDDWMVDERPAAGPTALKLIYDASQKEGRQKDWGAAYRLTFLRLACADGTDQVEVAYGQEQPFGATPFPLPITVSAGEDKFVLGTTNVYRTRGTHEKPQVEIRRAQVPVSFFETAAGTGRTELKEGSDQEDAGGSPRIAKLTNGGLAKSLRVLATRCGAQPAEPAAATPAMPPQATGVSASVPRALGLPPPGRSGEAQGEADRRVNAPRSP
jgi:hypothetical protein